MQICTLSVCSIYDMECNQINGLVDNPLLEFLVLKEVVNLIEQQSDYPVALGAVKGISVSNEIHNEMTPTRDHCTKDVREFVGFNNIILLFASIQLIVSICPQCGKLQAEPEAVKQVVH